MSAQKSSKKWMIWAQRIGVVLLLVLLAWAIPRLEFSKMAEAFLEARWEFVILAVVSVAFFWALRATLLGFIVKAQDASARWSSCWLAITVGMATDQVVPGRVGYFARWLILSSRVSLSRAAVFFSIVCFMLLEATSLVVFVAIAIGLSVMGGASGSLVDPQNLVIPAVIILSLLLLVAGFPIVEKILRRSQWAESSIGEAFLQLGRLARSPKRLMAWLGMAFVIWVSQALIVEFSAAAFQISLSFSQIFILLAAINLAIIIPIVPGNVGSMHVVIVAVMKQFGVDPSISLPFAIVYHAVHLLPILAVGGAGALIAGIRPSRLSAQFSRSKEEIAA